MPFGGQGQTLTERLPALATHGVAADAPRPIEQTHRRDAAGWRAFATGATALHPAR